MRTASLKWRDLYEPNFIENLHRQPGRSLVAYSAGRARLLRFKISFKEPSMSLSEFAPLQAMAGYLLVRWRVRTISGTRL